MKKRRFRPLKCINGTKGAIALFLAVLMTPFLSVAMILVEMGRYNSAVSILDEALGVSSVSTLANYDSYLKDRWGLFAVKQDSDIDSVFGDNLRVNSGVLGTSLKLNTVSAKGTYALNESEILYNQILEYSKLNSPTKVATNFMNLSDLIAKLEKFNSLNNILSLVTSGVDAVDSTITLVESSEDLKEIANNIDDYKDDYNTAYSNFESAVNNLIDALNEPRPDSEEDPEGAEAYDDNIESLEKKAEKAKKNYAKVLGDISGELSKYKTEMKDCNDAIVKIQNDIASAAASATAVNADLNSKKKDLDALNAEIKRMESEGMNESNTAYSHALDYRAALEVEVADLNTQKGIATAAQAGLSSASTGWKDSFNSYSDSTLGSVISGFNSLKTKVNNYSISGVSSSSTKISTDAYKTVSIGGYIDSTAIDSYLDEQKEELTSGSLSALIKGVTSFFNSILKMSIFYDPALSTYIDVNYYQNAFGGLPGADSSGGGVMEVITNIGNLLTDIKDFSTNIAGLKLVKALKELKSIIQDIESLIKSLVQFGIDIAKNIYGLLTSYERLYYTTYSSFNLPCRTDCKGGALSFTTMTGYKMGSTSLPSTGINSTSVSVFDDLAALINTIKSAAAGSGDDITFSGAELEYVLFGSNSEIANQLYVFCALYLVRLLLDIPAILSNAEVQSLAAASTFGYPVVMILEILAEPLAETIVLVNGGSVNLVPTTIFLTPTGLPKLITQLISICSFTTAQTEAIQGELVSAFGATQDDYNYQKTLNDYQSSGGGGSGSAYLTGLTSLTYREYCFILMLLTVTKEQQMGRLSNLIQMESLYYYKTKGASYVFDLRNAFTFIEAETNISVKQMLPSLADSSLFTIDRKHYRGY